MNVFRIAAFVCAGAIASSVAAPAHAQTATNITNAPSRFSGPGVYTGPPQLPLTLSMVVAGGGPSNFQTLTLVQVLAGDKTTAEVAALKQRFGTAKVTNFVNVFKFVVDDSLRIVKEKNVALPSAPSPDPKNGEALAGALWAAGQTGTTFNVEVMLDRLVSHPIHDQVMDDIDKKYGIAADADYHAILTQSMHDLATVYKFNTAGQPSGM